MRYIKWDWQAMDNQNKKNCNHYTSISPMLEQEEEGRVGFLLGEVSRSTWA